MPYSQEIRLGGALLRLECVTASRRDHYRQELRLTIKDSHTTLKLPLAIEHTQQLAGMFRNLSETAILDLDALEADRAAEAV